MQMSDSFTQIPERRFLSNGDAEYVRVGVRHVVAALAQVLESVQQDDASINLKRSQTHAHLLIFNQSSCRELSDFPSVAAWWNNVEKHQKPAVTARVFLFLFVLNDLTAFKYYFMFLIFHLSKFTAHYFYI